MLYMMVENDLYTVQDHMIWALQASQVHLYIISEKGATK